jgi:hypothetical protein
MTKSKKNSHFELIRGDRLPEYGNRIVQIDVNKQYQNNGYGVYICEVADEEVNND